MQGFAGLKLKAKKCQLFQEEIPFLGHIASAAGIGADPAKCQQDWSVPRDLHEVRSFVRLCSYYRRHIQGFTELAAPLYELATKGTDFEWPERRNEAFRQLKNALTSAPILGFPREEGLWYLDTDASDVGTRAVLSQMQNGEERVIAYVSKSLEGSEQRYCTARKELLAVVQALKYFKCYLYVQKITVRTDNSAVSWLHRRKDPVGQPARWIEVIDTYDITFQHRPGRKHRNADALSRYPCRQWGGDCAGVTATGMRAVTRSQRCEPGWTPEEMAAGQDANPDIGTIMRWKRAGNNWNDGTYRLNHERLRSKVVLEVCRLFRIHKTRTTPYHPRSDVFIERSFRTLGRCLKAACRTTKQEWDELVPLMLMSYRDTPQARTGGDPQHIDAGPADTTSGPGHVWDTPGAGRGRNKGERVRGRTPGGVKGGVPTRQRGAAMSDVASKT